MKAVFNAVGERKSCLSLSNLGAVQLPTVEIDGQQKQLKAFAGSKAVGVNPHADNQEVAMEFASFLASPAGQKLRYLISGVIPAAKELANDPQVSANPVAVAEINTMLNASVMQPTLFAMGNYWTPMTNFGCGIACGEINESNYMEYVDQMMSQFGNIEPAEEYEIANVQYPGGGSGSIPFAFTIIARMETTPIGMYGCGTTVLLRPHT